MQTLRANLRIHVVGIAILLCSVLVFVALTSKDAAPRIFFALFAVIVSGFSLAQYKKESDLALNHLVVSGTVTEVKTRTRGRVDIKYQFTGLDGKQHQGGSDWSAQSVQTGSWVIVLYKPLDPAASLPLSRFLFFSFDPADAADRRQG